MEPPTTSELPNTYQQLVTAVTSCQIVRLGYQGGESGEVTTREIEPIGLYLSDHWHVVAYCRLRQAFRNFRLDRISSLAITNESFAARPETLQQYWTDQAKRLDQQKVVIHFDPSKVSPAQVQHLHDTKHKYGWAYEQTMTDGSMEILFFVGSLDYLSLWLLPFAGSIKIMEPASLPGHLSRLAKQVHDSFYIEEIQFARP